MPQRAHDGRATSQQQPGHEALELRRMSTPTPEELEDEADDMRETQTSYDLTFSNRGVEAEEKLNRRTVRKLDFILLPFLALLFLLNSLDRSNIGNAETADFTKDVDIAPSTLNTAVAIFFAFFVALQPLGAALGRKYGMAVWVPGCMTVWGICTALHVWVRAAWQLITLRIIIGCLEAGFYPVTVSYLSLFYTRYEFARRLSLFYGQYAVAGALGGLLSYVVFSQFPHKHETEDTDTPDTNGWKSWEVLFLLEGGATVLIAAIGFLWLPHNARTAWFFRPDERVWAEERIRRDREEQDMAAQGTVKDNDTVWDDAFAIGDEEQRVATTSSEETHGLLHAGGSHEPDFKGHGLSAAPMASSTSKPIVTDDRGLSRADILSAALDWKLWYLLACNILSSIPVTAFSVFLPLVLHPMTTTPAYANLMAAPPFLIGAIVLYSFAYWSDRSRQRLVPILWGLGLLLFGLAAVVLISANVPIVRYCALCVLLSGTFVASPLTIAWFTGNIPEAGKRAVVLGINGWGNLAGVFSSLLFAPRFAPNYTLPFFATLACVLLAFMGYAGFKYLLIWENRRRARMLREWSEEDVEAERRFGKGPVGEGSSSAILDFITSKVGGARLARRIRSWWPEDEGRKGDERITFVYGL